MPVKEALFWIGLTVFGAGLAFFIEPGHVKVATIVTVAGFVLVAYSVVKYHYPFAEKNLFIAEDIEIDHAATVGFGDAGEGIEWVRKCVRGTTLFEVLPSPPLDLLMAGSSVIDVHVAAGSVQLALPNKKTCEAIVRDVLKRDMHLTPGTAEHEEKYNHLTRQRLGQDHISDGEAKFSENRDHLPDDSGAKHLSVIAYLREHPALQRAKKENVRNYLRTGVYFGDEPFNRLDWNGHMFCLKGIRWLMHDNDVCQKLILALRASDYYTYRTIADCSADILNDCGMSEMLGEDLGAYCKSNFQDVIHGGLGILVFVHCKGSNTILLRRRSEGGGADYQDAGKWSSTANEGLSPYKDIDERSGQLKPALEWVKRALERELFGKANTERFKLCACYLTGVLLYRPNLTFNLAFFVSLDCDPDVLVRQIPLSPEGKQEFGEVKLVRFTFDALNHFLAQSVASKEWDEGALAALGMAFPLIGKIN